MNNIFFSIIIPTFNRADLLIEAIESVLKQDYCDYELLICDNCSTDHTEKVVENYLHFSQVKYIRNDENIGFSKNWYNAVNYHAKGEWILLMCDDDYLICDQLLADANKLINENPRLNLIHGNVIYKNQTTNTEYSTNSDFLPITRGLDYFIRYMNEYRAIVSTLALLKKDDGIRNEAFSKDIYCIDTSLWTRLMLEGDVGFINKEIAVYRFHAGNTTYNKSSINRAFDALEDILEIVEMAKQKNYYTSSDLEVWKINMISQEFYGLLANNVSEEDKRVFTQEAIKRFPFLANVIYQYATYYLNHIIE